MSKEHVWVIYFHKKSEKFRLLFQIDFRTKFILSDG